jgi:parvulin-like peptidyl-prolyl isomerase
MKLKLLFILFAFAVQINAQNEKEVIAKIGDKVIQLNEFRYRYEFTPQIDRKYNDKGKAKEELLYTLIAENLFSLEAERLGYDTLQILKENYIPLEKMYVRDALYKKEISDKVKLDVSKFNKGLKLANEKLFVDFIYAGDQQSIEEAYSLLLSDSNFDSLVTLLKNAEYVSEPYEVNYGKMNFLAEEEIYKLGINEFTKPIESPDGWYIFRLLSKIPVTFKSPDERTSLVRKVVEGRVEDSIYSDFRNKFFKDLNVTADGGLFWYFVEEVQKLLEVIKTEQKVKENEKISITNNYFVILKNSIEQDSLNKVFIRFEENPITFNQFLREFIFEGFFTFTTDINQVASQLRSRVKRQIELELLTREAYKRGMESLPEVISATKIWKDNYLATLLLKNVVKNTEITEKDLTEYLTKKTGIPITETQIKIIELLTDSLEVIKEALTYSDNEFLFRDFAKIHTKREEARANNGEIGYFSPSEYGEIGNIAASMKIGDVYGPLQIDDSYSLFKVIDKKENKIELKNELDSDTELKIKHFKITEHLENLAADLAEKYNVTINTELMNSLELLNAQMVVFRYMGFGGRIQAFPYSSPFYNWKEKWEQKKKDVL